MKPGEKNIHYGDVMEIYDLCGRAKYRYPEGVEDPDEYTELIFDGYVLCPDCRRSGDGPCARYFVAGQVRGTPNY